MRWSCPGDADRDGVDGLLERDGPMSPKRTGVAPYVVGGWRIGPGTENMSGVISGEFDVFANDFLMIV